MRKELFEKCKLSKFSFPFPKFQTNGSLAAETNSSHNHKNDFVIIVIRIYDVTTEKVNRVNFDSQFCNFEIEDLFTTN